MEFIIFNEDYFKLGLDTYIQIIDYHDPIIVIFILSRIAYKHNTIMITKLQILGQLLSHNTILKEYFNNKNSYFALHKTSYTSFYTIRTFNTTYEVEEINNIFVVSYKYENTTNLPNMK